MARASLPRLIFSDRTVLLAYSVALALAVWWERAIKDAVESRGSGLGAMGAGEAIGAAALLLAILRIGERKVLRPLDLVIVCASMALAVVPSLNILSLGVTLFALRLTAKREEPLATIGQLLLAFTFYEVIGRVMFNAIAPQVLSWEAAAVSALLYFTGNFTSNGLDISAASGHTIMLETQCSSFHNVSTATLIWLSLIKIERNAIDRRDVVLLALMIGATVLVNAVRIALMAQSQSMYEYWHNGPGILIFSMTLLTSVLGIFLAGRSSWRPFLSAQTSA